MRKRRKTLARVLSTVVAVVLAVEAPAHAAAPSGDFEQLIAEADGHADSGAHQQALETYIAAFEAMPDELKASEVGEFVAQSAAKSAIADFEDRQDAAALTQGREVVARFVELASAAGGSVGAAQARLDELDALMPEPDSTDFDSAEPDDIEPDDTEPDPVEPDTPDRKNLAIGLVAGGAVGLAVGLSLVVVGTRQVPWYEERLANRGWTPETEGYDEEIANAERIRNIDIGIGASLAVVGLGLGIGGAVLLAKQGKQSGTQASITPRIGRHGFGLNAQVRF